MFRYEGNLLISKSWANRALVIQSYLQSPRIAVLSDSDDVRFLKQAIQEIPQTQEFDLGQGGTSFRFFCFLISRRPGRWIVHGHTRLFERPQAGLIELLKNLGVSCELQKNALVLQTEGWQVPSEIHCGAEQSSQFVSGLLLNCWQLSKELKLLIKKPIVSESYLKMTIGLLRSFGCQIEMTESSESLHLLIPAHQRPSEKSVLPELDLSSAFSLAAAAVVNGEAVITNWNAQSSQPDRVFLEIFQKMNIHFVQEENRLKISKQSAFQAVSVDLNKTPDLFPVLAVLCALAKGRSDLHGAGQLRFKESDRLAKTKELLDLTGYRTVLKSDGLVIEGQSSTFDQGQKLIFDPDQDHRMAMAAGLFKLAGYQVQIQNPEVVSKSYPDFWKDIGVTP